MGTSIRKQHKETGEEHCEFLVHDTIKKSFNHLRYNHSITWEKIA